MTDLTDQANAIRTREDFVVSVHQLVRNYRERSGSWQNRDLETYLNALAAWVEDMDFIVDWLTD